MPRSKIDSWLMQQNGKPADPTILENLIKLREIIAATPEESINLNNVADMAGIAALHPYFHAQGLHWSDARGLLLRDTRIDHDDDRLEPLFGKDVGGLFAAFGCGTEDTYPQMACDQWEDIVTDLDTGKVMSHKELALWRLDQRIKELS